MKCCLGIAVFEHGFAWTAEGMEADSAPLRLERTFKTEGSVCCFLIALRKCVSRENIVIVLLILMSLRLPIEQSFYILTVMNMLCLCYVLGTGFSCFVGGCIKPRRARVTICLRPLRTEVGKDSA
jgi:hypothetical protein